MKWALWRKLREIVWISSEEFLPGGGEMFISVALWLIGMIVGFGEISWVFVQREDMGIILITKVSEFILD
jgi:hypothetical protein